MGSSPGQARHPSRGTTAVVFVSLSCEISGAWGLATERFFNDSIDYINNERDIDFSKFMHARSSRVINFRVRPKALVDGLRQWCPMAVMPVSPPASSR